MCAGLKVSINSSPRSDCGIRAQLHPMLVTRAPVSPLTLMNSHKGRGQTVEYFRQSVLILSISLGTPVRESSLPSYSADMKPL